MSCRAKFDAWCGTAYVRAPIGLLLTIGAFDGVHRGLRDFPWLRDVPAVWGARSVLSFEPIRAVFRPRPPPRG